MIPHDTQLQIGSLLFEGIDQIDLTGPFEVLSRIPNTTYRFTGGVTAGIDGALRLAAELRGNEVAQAIQLHVAYAPEPPFDGGTPRRGAVPDPGTGTSIGADHHGAARATGAARRR